MSVPDLSDHTFATYEYETPLSRIASIVSTTLPRCDQLALVGVGRGIVSLYFDFASCIWTVFVLVLYCDYLGTCTVFRQSSYSYCIPTLHGHSPALFS
ncbi:uncharacterized protein YALI1_A16136g [Yarrowia lipolytica]|uniref:Uncharacterized protein n=1 Tax=Yarrowia lipolytica TaxID=4952 RepID=A0A1D8N500_YARLL|nr:hypothetical protein YALI1_A16136g [Yarrowia lipolytica]